MMLSFFVKIDKNPYKNLENMTGRYFFFNKLKYVLEHVLKHILVLLQL